MLPAIPRLTEARFARASDEAELEEAYAEIERPKRTPRRGAARRALRPLPALVLAALLLFSSVSLALHLGQEDAMTLLALLGFELLRPVDLAWLLIVPAVAVLGSAACACRTPRRDGRAGVRALLRWSRPRRDAAAPGPGGPGLALLALAVTGPCVDSLREVERKGLDLIVALDASKSMLVPDLGRTRLEEAKRQVKALFPRLQDRVALISFGEAGGSRR